MNVGGPAVLIAEVINGLSDDFEHILVTGLVSEGEKDYLDEGVLNGLVVKLPRLGRNIFIYQDIVTLFSICKILRQFSPDIIHTHTSKAGLLGRLAGIMVCRKAVRIHTFHGHLLYGYFSPIKTNAIIKIERLFAIFTHVLVAVSETIRRDLIDAQIGLNSKWEVIPPGVSNECRSIYPSVESNIKKLFQIAWVGRFTDIKNPILAIQALEEAINGGLTDLELVMVGDGELLEACKKYASTRSLPIQFLGWKSDVVEIIRNCELLLLTSKNEGLPLVVLEAASVSKMSIATNVGGIKDFVSDGDNGTLVKEDASAIAREITLLFNDRGRLQNMGVSAFQTYSNGFTAKAYIRRHEELYGRVMKPRVP